MPLTPALPAQQHEAIARLKYGRATRTLLQFNRRFWRGPGGRARLDPRCHSARCGMATKSSGDAAVSSRCSPAAAPATDAGDRAKEGPAGLAQSLDWLGARESELVASRQIVWEQDQFARGGYAFFDPSFDPELRAWLARPCGRLFFAGEHTSLKWQGYMNGAIESGRRAAVEIRAVMR